MMKKLLTILFCTILLLSVVACRSSDGSLALPQSTTPSAAQTTEPTKETLPQETFGPQADGGVFKLDNIVRITFYSHYGEGTGVQVPAENMQEIIAWLDTYTLGEPAEHPLPPGTDWVYVEIEYSYGAVFKTGMKTVDFAGTQYYIHGGEAPACYTEMINSITAH